MKNNRRYKLAVIIIVFIVFLTVIILRNDAVPWYNQFQQYKNSEIVSISIEHFFTSPLNEEVKNADLILEEVPSGLKATKILTTDKDFQELRKYIIAMKCHEKNYSDMNGVNDNFIIRLTFENGNEIDMLIKKYTEDTEAATILLDSQGISHRYLLSSKSNNLLKKVNDLFYK